MMIIYLKNPFKLLIKHPDITSGSSKRLRFWMQDWRPCQQEQGMLKPTQLFQLRRRLGKRFIRRHTQLRGDECYPRGMQISKEKRCTTRIVQLQANRSKLQGRSTNESGRGEGCRQRARTRTESQRDGTGPYLGQQVNDFHVKMNCQWIDERLVIPMRLRTAVVNRTHSFHHGQGNMFV